MPSREANGGEGERDPESFTLKSPLLASSFRSGINSTSQVAIVGANVCPIESLDYEIAENVFFKQDWRSREKLQIFQYTFVKWLLCFLVGGILGLIGFCSNIAVENIAGIKFVVTSNMMLMGRYGMAFLIFSVSNFVLTTFAAIITAFIAPVSAGSGIPEVKAYLNGVDAPGIFTLKTLFVKIVGSLTAVSGSLFIGKAGPMVHTGACIAAWLSQGGSRKYQLTWRWLRYFKNDRDRRDLVTSGSAAGIAAAFRAPVGGLLFALEEMASWWRSALIWRAFFTTAMVALVLRALIDVCESGKCGLFGKGGLIMFDISSSTVVYHLYDVPAVLLLGVVGGLLGSLYNFLLMKVLRIYSLINERGVFWKIFLACIVSIFTSCLLFGLPWLAACRLCPSDAGEACPTIGRSGAASLLGGTMRMTVSLCVILLELTNNLLLLPLMMLVLLVSKTVADAFNGNVYDLIMKAKGFPYLETHVEPYMRQLTVGDVVTGPLQLFNGIEKVKNVVHVLRTTRHNGFPVVDEPPISETPILYGLILRAHLVELLKKKVFLAEPVLTSIDAFEQISAEDFAKRSSGHIVDIDDIELTEAEMDMYIDLHPFTNASPYTVVETMSLGKALTLFRDVGLRHLLVIPKISSRWPVVGILTRHDFMEEHVLALRPNLATGRWKRLRLKLPRFLRIF
ncbi:hypothetical protein MLD38_014838 [Melastoma candidum]|uniref:Uncharacterized protein n=1 Tax=Melastoma candidum TaxID=119954 RepID=A0ACB9RDY1_9MYRT|nr:hypothetical protein MLD38_014838 [Melastoma candidum]